MSKHHHDHCCNKGDCKHHFDKCAKPEAPKSGAPKEPCCKPPQNNGGHCGPKHKCC